jgi:hypothetical protein
MFFLLQYGEIVALIMSPKKKGSALVEFKTKEACVSIAMIFSYGTSDLTSGFVSNNHFIIIEQMFDNEKACLCLS